MKIKHFAGYGCVEAHKVKKSTRGGITNLVVEVVGNHEWGLERRDVYDLKRWLVDRFDKSARDINPYSIDYQILLSTYERVGGLDVEKVVYSFEYAV